MSENLRKENLRAPISKNELQRRWSAVREAMVKNGLDCLLMQNSNQYMGGYVRYFLDIPAENSFPLTLIFPLEEGMTLVSHGAKPLASNPPEWALHGVEEIVSLPYILTFNFTNTMDAKAVVDILMKKKSKSIGIVAKALMAATTYEYVKDALTEVSMHDATDMVDEIKAVKSEEEISFVQKTAEMQDIIWGATLASVRPGVREYELRSEIQRLCTAWGSEEQLIMVGSAPAGTPAGHKGYFFQNRTLQYGDQVMIMIEVNGPGGFWTQIGRTVCIGDAPTSMLDAWKDAVVAQDESAELMKPGADPKEIFKAHNERLTRMRYEPERRFHAHGQGYDVAERPAIRPEETMTIKTGMNIAVHPITRNTKAYAFCCDNYLITESGARRIHKTPREVFVV